MAKIYETSEDVKSFIESKFSKLSSVINFKVMSLSKSKSIIKVAKANQTTEFLTKSSDVVTIYVFEEAFDRLPEIMKNMFVDFALNQVDYDYEKDKILIETNPYKPLVGLRKTYGDDKTLNMVELQDVVIEDIMREEKEKAEAEKEAKKKNRQAV